MLEPTKEKLTQKAGLQGSGGLIVQEWIEPVGGAEKVLDSFAAVFPKADMYCLWNDAPNRYTNRTVMESPLAKTFLRRHKAIAMPLMPHQWKKAGDCGKQYEWVLSSSYLFSHQALADTIDPSRRFAYVHTPARYIWNPEMDQRGRTLAAKVGGGLFRKIDKKKAATLQNVAANSAFVQERIWKTWGIESTVIHPPVDVERLMSVENWANQLDENDQQVFESLPEIYLLGASRFVSYKRLDVAIKAGSAAQIPVVIAGGGPQEEALKAIAADSNTAVHFVPNPSDQLLAAIMQHAYAFIFPPVEDFGIMPVEAMALGVPVLVNHAGGAAESVINGETGIHLPDFHTSTLREAINLVPTIEKAAAQNRAQTFSRERFENELVEWMGVGKKIRL